MKGCFGRSNVPGKEQWVQVQCREGADVILGKVQGQEGAW